jgi:arylsulfatase A
LRSVDFVQRDSLESTRMTTRRNFLHAAGATLLSANSVAAQGRKPNIVFIMADDLGYGHLGCYGQNKINTPNLDRMSAGGMRFTQAYAGCTVCAPSRSSLMTGQHTGHTPIRSNSGGVPLLPEEKTVAEALKGAGYRTGIFGKWGLGDAGTTGTPNKKGFDEFFGYLHQLHAHFYYTHFLWRNDKKVFLANRHDWRREYSHDLITSAALDFIRKNRNNPFFLYLPITIPHAELLVPDDSLAEYDGRFPETPFTSEPRRHYAPNPKPRATLAGMITRMDRGVGNVMALLSELGLSENTLVIFTSDNGPDAANGNDPEFFQAAGPFRGYKTDLYEGGIRVPMIAHWPGKIKPGVVSDQLIALWDFFRTAVDLADVAAPNSLDGRSFAGQLMSPAAAGAPPREDLLYWERSAGDGIVQSARLREWKAVRPKPDGPVELYNLAADIRERQNVAGKHADIAADLERLMRSAHRPPRPQTEHPPDDGRRYH